MLRRVAITLAGITAAGFMAAAPAAATAMDFDGGPSDGGHYSDSPFKSDRYGCDNQSGDFYLSNVGGPYGITEIEASHSCGRDHHKDNGYNGRDGHNDKD
ncbi:hypothetical protein [Streptomyces chryseus]|uniref:Secreted protein n=1 Tax=Streptomyces chryseus TaxID=68186 RepID=A0ABQ3E1B2_9ACTN|nr:hypothetical protein [Streptomyces chryseus]GHB20230.1 hypothetical protein GCM10010346_50010 [Streptomyces chryseus]